MRAAQGDVPTNNDGGRHCTRPVLAGYSRYSGFSEHSGYSGIQGTGYSERGGRRGVPAAERVVVRRVPARLRPRRSDLVDVHAVDAVPAPWLPWAESRWPVPARAANQRIAVRSGAARAAPPRPAQMPRTGWSPSRRAGEQRAGGATTLAALSRGGRAACNGQRCSGGPVLCGAERAHDRCDRILRSHGRWCVATQRDTLHRSATRCNAAPHAAQCPLHLPVCRRGAHHRELRERPVLLIVPVVSRAAIRQAGMPHAARTHTCASHAARTRVSHAARFSVAINSVSPV
jgi:hypothetical protein